MNDHLNMADGGSSTGRGVRIERQTVPRRNEQNRTTVPSDEFKYSKDGKNNVSRVSISASSTSPLSYTSSSETARREETTRSAEKEDVTSDKGISSGANDRRRGAEVAAETNETREEGGGIFPSEEATMSGGPPGREIATGRIARHRHSPSKRRGAEDGDYLKKRRRRAAFAVPLSRTSSETWDGDDADSSSSPSSEDGVKDSETGGRGRVGAKPSSSPFTTSSSTSSRRREDGSSPSGERRAKAAGSKRETESSPRNFCMERGGVPASTSDACRVASPKSKSSSNDASTTMEEDDTSTLASSASKSSCSKRPRTFPEQLFDMLNEEACASTSHSISWLPDGKGFEIRRPNLLMREVLPKYFARCRFDSFVRKLYRWGFRKTDAVCDRHDNCDNDDNAHEETLVFYHKYFQRSGRWLCRKMYSIVAPKKKMDAVASGRSQKKPSPPASGLDPPGPSSRLVVSGGSAVPSPPDPSSGYPAMASVPPNAAGMGRPLLQGMSPAPQVVPTPPQVVPTPPRVIVPALPQEVPPALPQEVPPAPPQIAAAIPQGIILQPPNPIGAVAAAAPPLPIPGIPQGDIALPRAQNQASAVALPLVPPALPSPQQWTAADALVETIWRTQALTAHTQQRIEAERARAAAAAANLATLKVLYPHLFR